MYGDFPAKNTVCTPYIRINIWFWPTLLFCRRPAWHEQTQCRIWIIWSRGCQTKKHTRVGQNRIYTPHVTLCMVISLLKKPYVHRLYLKIYGSGNPRAYALGAVSILAGQEGVNIGSIRTWRSFYTIWSRGYEHWEHTHLAAWWMQRATMMVVTERTRPPISTTAPSSKPAG
jgi:hypothetical protein